jgi:hypothetical protein
LELVLGGYSDLVTLGGAADVGGSILNTLRKIQLGMELLASYPSRFGQATYDLLASHNLKGDVSTNSTPAQLAEASVATPLSSVQAFSKRTTALSQGDYIRSQNETGLGRNVLRFQSTVERVVEQGDTLPNLAAKYLGDARLWKHLAVLNKLSAPYISPDGLPSTLTVGDTILVPSTARAPDAQASPVVLGVTLERPAEEHALGEDLQLMEVSPGLFDLSIDTENGSVDARTVAGITNLQQAVLTRLITERGTDSLYKQLGTQRVIGLGLTIVDLETAQLRLAAAVTADPRVAGVRKMEVTNGPPDDAVYVDMEVEVKGLSRPERITLRR